MKVIYECLRAPHLTEKTTAQKDEFNILCFRVQRQAGKIQIKEAVERLFDVKVEQVHTVNMAAKPKRLGRFQGYRSEWKKAYVRLRKGEKKIEFFEGM